MALVKCKECEKEVSSTAKVCPHCGISNPAPIAMGSGEIIKNIVGLLSMLLIGSFIWFVINDDSKASSTNINSSTNSISVMDVEIRDILNAYTNNEVGADNKYKNKRIRVTGIVSDIKKDLFDSLYVTLGTGRNFEIPEIQAFFHSSMNDQLARLNKGSRLTVECTVDGLMMNVIAKKCSIK